MAFYKSQMPRSAAISLKNQLLIAIGGRAFVHLPSSPAEFGDFTPLDSGTEPRPSGDPRDGQEVEIVAWRPQSAQGLSYHVRRLSDRREWWARAICLRKSASVKAVEE
jgi:hypothetical protein